MYWLILVFLLTSAFWGLILYERILYYEEKIQNILQELEKDYDEELLDKRTFRKHRDKLINERDKLICLINYMKKQAKENRLYKKYFYKKIDNEKNIL